MIKNSNPTRYSGSINEDNVTEKAIINALSTYFNTSQSSRISSDEEYIYTAVLKYFKLI